MVQLSNFKNPRWRCTRTAVARNPCVSWAFLLCLVVCSDIILDSVCHWSWVGFSRCLLQILPRMDGSYVGEYLCTVIIYYVIFSVVYRHRPSQWTFDCRYNFVQQKQTLDCYALLLARNLQASQRYCDESGRHFWIYLLENWTDLDKTWQRDAEWGKSDPIIFWRDNSRSPRRRIPTSMWWITRTHLVTYALPISAELGRNSWIHVPVNSFIVKFEIFPLRGRFSPKTDFLVFNFT